MGLFSRLRSSSGQTPASTSQMGSPSSQTSGRAQQQATHTAAPSSPLTPSRLSSDLLSRPVLPTSASSASFSSVGKAKGKAWTSSGKIWKGKEKEGNLISGPQYDHTPTHGTLRQSESTPRALNHAAEGRGKRDTMVFLGQPNASESTPQSPTERHRRQKPDIRPRATSLDPGSNGLLGKLDFEQKLPDGTRQSRDSWVISSEPASALVSPVETTASFFSHTNLPSKVLPPKPPASEHDHVMIDKEDATGYLEENGIGRTSEEIEVLESAEKKKGFWKMRPRRFSRAASEAEDEQPGSPTPRKATLPQPLAAHVSPTHPSTTLSEIQAPRPPTVRRQSSSLFQNPFHRSLSRASLGRELDDPDQAIDDGSFQLRGFRHISGASEMDKVDDYANIPRSSMIGLDMSAQSPVEASNSPVTAAPPSSFHVKTRSASRPQMSRPPSVAASLASVDDFVASSSKVSVAAFRRGIRRPSEGPAAMSDGGHGGDDEDDLPLGMIKSRTRTSSHLSLHSLKDKAEERERYEAHRPSPSPSPGPSATPVRAASPVPPKSEMASSASPSTQRMDLLPSLSQPKPGAPADRRGDQASSGFLVKSRVSPVPSKSHPIGQPGPESGKPISNRTTTPSPLPPQDGDKDGQARRDHVVEIAPKAVDSIPDEAKMEVVESPIATSNSDIIGSYLTWSPDVLSSSPPQPVHHIAPKSTSASRAPTPPRTRASVIDLSDELDPKQLPLPPDLMPDTPPQTSAPTSPRGHQKRLSLLEEPLKVFTGLWTSSDSTNLGTSFGGGKAGREDELDTDFIVNSMALLGEESPVVKAPGGSYESAMSNGRRPPLSSRLASLTAQQEQKALAAQVSQPNPSSVAQARTKPEPVEFLPLASDESTRVPPPVAVKKSSRQQLRQMGSKSHLRGKAAWSSSEDESDSGANARSTKGRGASEQGSKTVSGGAMVKDVSVGESSDDGTDKRQRAPVMERRVPGGPRKPSLVNLAIVEPSRKIILTPDESSDEEESLSMLRARASRSNLSVNKIGVSPQVRPGALPTSSTMRSVHSAQSIHSEHSDRSDLSAESTRSTRPTQPLVGSRASGPPNEVHPSVPVFQADVNKPQIAPKLPKATTPSPKVTSGSLPPKATSRPSSRQRLRDPSPNPASVSTEVRSSFAKASPRIVNKIPLTKHLMNGSTSSPASSQSGWTSESVIPNPSTPQETVRRGSVPGVEPPAKGEQQWTTEQNQSTPPFPTNPPGWNMSTPPFDPRSTPPQGMDPTATMHMMKQAWQAQFMAAAYRASEDEWERASMSGGPAAGGSSVHGGSMRSMSPMSGQGMMPYPMPPMPPMAMPSMPPQMVMPMGYPYPGYSYPQAHPAHQYPPFQPMTWYPPPQEGMYSYAQGSQSVFGAHFGPAQSPVQYTQSEYGSPQYRQQHVHRQSPLGPGPGPGPGVGYDHAQEQGIGVATQHSPRPQPQLRSSSYGQTYPTEHDAHDAQRASSVMGYNRGGGGGGESWRPASHVDGQWDDAPTPRKVRPSSSYPIN